MKMPAIKNRETQRISEVLIKQVVYSIQYTCCSNDVEHYEKDLVLIQRDSCIFALSFKEYNMIDIEKQIAYWQVGATDDLESAKILIESNRLLHGLFFCHLVIEKAIKACVVMRTKEIAPRSHNLLYLSEIAELEFNEEDEIFLGILMKYQLQGRYPDYNPIIPDKTKVNEYFTRTEKLLAWLQVKL